MFYESLRDIENKISTTIYSDIYALLHYHCSIEFICVLEGEIEVTSGNHTIRLLPNQIAFIGSYHPHCVRTVSSSKAITFIVPYKYFKEFTEGEVSLNYFGLLDSEINEKIFNIIEEISKIESDEQKELLIKSYFNVIIALISVYCKLEICNDRYSDLIVKIIDYFNNNYFRKITLDELASEFGYSKYYFSRLFNKIFNCNLNTYINQLRSSIVKEQFQRCDKKTEAIISSGFNYASTYYRHLSRKPPASK